MRKILLFLLFCFAGIASKAGDPVIYTDYNPQYTKWQDFYILDKIEYTEKQTIMYFRFVAHNLGVVTYYGKNGEAPWYLKNLTPSAGAPKSFELQEVRNIMVDGKVVKASLKNEPQFDLQHDPNTIHTCQVVFNRLPPSATQVDLVEGRGNEFSTKNFNCFAVTIKPFDSKDLGTKADMEKNISKFEETNLEKSVVPPPPPPKKENIKVYFLDNKVSYISDDLSIQLLTYVRNYLFENQNYRIIIHGYADSGLDTDKAQTISEERANYVMDCLKRLDVPLSRMEIEAHGSSEPAAATKSGRNRRVEIEFVKSDL